MLEFLLILCKFEKKKNQAWYKEFSLFRCKFLTKVTLKLENKDTKVYELGRSTVDVFVSNYFFLIFTFQFCSSSYSRNWIEINRKIERSEGYHFAVKSSQMLEIVDAVKD